MGIVLAKVAYDTALTGALALLGVGSWTWPAAWVLMATMLVVRTITAVLVYRVSPELMLERSKLPVRKDQPARDRALLLGVIITGFLALPFLAGYDVRAWHALPAPPAWIRSLGLVAFVLGWAFKGVALYTNGFATSVVRLQNERQHRVVDSGIYRFVRHPFYTGTPLVLVGMCLWLGSYLAAISATVAVSFVVLRLLNEERFLSRELPGYREYSARVRYRLIPWLW